jgi:tRNA threonylcarbamoyladenosine biosynthesis protein TsaE
MPSVVLVMHLPSAGDTELLGAALACSVPVPVDLGAVVYLHGDLGAGKTTCVRAMLRSLGIGRQVRSPTYTLVESYTAPGLTCVHVDLYRLNGAGEVEGLGLRDVAGPGCLLLVEWPERGGAWLPRPDVELRLEYEEDGRRASLSSCSKRGEDWLRVLAGDTRLIPYVYNMT